MTPHRALSRASLLAFVIALLTTLSELGWWTWLNLRHSARERQDHLQRLARDAQLAEQVVFALTRAQQAAHEDEATSRQRAESEVAPIFPELTFDHGHAAARVDAALTLDRRFASHVRMFVAEGSVFALVLCLGAWLILRAMRHELRIVRQTENFLAAVTHELKSPLASLRLWVETLERAPPPQWQAPLAYMRGDVDRLETLIANVLMAARIEKTPGTKEPLAPPAAPLQVAEALEALCQQLQGQAEERGFALRLSLPGASVPPLEVRIDRPAFDLVVRNLVDNAIKYGGNGGVIDVQLEGFVRAAVLTVRDYGLGLAAGEEDRIFDKFYRVGNEMVRQSEGTGLGLYLVRAVVAQGGGRVEAKSDGLSRGTSLRVTWPLAPAADAPGAKQGRPLGMGQGDSR